VNPPAHQFLTNPRPVREVFAGRGVPEEVLAEQERMDQILFALFPGLLSGGRVLIDNSDWEDEEI